MDILTAILIYIAFFLLTMFFSNKGFFRKYLLLAMVVSIIIGVCYIIFFANDNNMKLMKLVFWSIPMICFFQIDKIDRSK